MNEKPYYGYKLASRRRRLLAYIINSIILSLVTTSIKQALGTYITLTDLLNLKTLKELEDLIESVSNPTNILVNALVEILVYGLYGYLCYPYLRGTLGHRILGMRVINMDRTTLNGNEGAIRELLKQGPFILSDISTLLELGVSSLINLAALIYNIWLLWDRNKQNVYDKIAKTYVVMDEDPLV
ncbi:MAG: RDD family protein [Bacteroidia bacterium]|nr:RDD family protein [Bacteroidia bacterium]MDW8346298.1 RDD family protein [Bacteroidia bacterium]